PGNGTQPPPGPLVKSAQHRWSFAETEVGAPSFEIARQFFDDLREAAASGSACQFPHSRFESGHRLRRQASLDGCPDRKAEAQEFSRPRRGDRTLGLVDLELETFGEELLDGRHHPLAGSLTAHINVAVI